MIEVKLTNCVTLFILNVFLSETCLVLVSINQCPVLVIPCIAWTLQYLIIHRSYLAIKGLEVA